jgi:hypothetical protein
MSGLAIMAVGIVLMTQIRAETSLPALWLWMFIAGVGIGPTLSVFTIVVQNAVPFSQLGVATSNLTFFRQIGGSIGLAITGTVFGTRLLDELPKQLAANGVPQPMIDQFANAGTANLDKLVGVGGDLGTSILNGVPAAAKPVVEPLIPAIVTSIHQAFTLGVASAFQIGAVTTVLAVVAALAVREIPLRSSNSAHAPAKAAPSITSASATD